MPSHLAKGDKVNEGLTTLDLAAGMEEGGGMETGACFENPPVYGVLSPVEGQSRGVGS
jgi:hypothetical protein